MKDWTKEEKYRYLKDPQELKELHEKTICSKYRQNYHIQPVTGLLNDPNGFVWFDGKWHLFYQWCPWGAVHGLKHWYHVVSDDLVTWKNLGLFIKPDGIYEYDNKGAFSGSAVVIDNELYLYYTGNNRDENFIRHPYTCLAKLGADGKEIKWPEPLICPNPDYTEHQRDPKIIEKPDGKYNYLILGAQTKKMCGSVIIYKSDELPGEWTFAGELKVPGFEQFGGMWECPSIEHIENKDILMFCPQFIKLPGRGDGTNHCGYIIGEMDWETLTFVPDGDFEVFDRGFDFYAASCANNISDKNKAIMIAWMGLSGATYPTDEEEWSGCLTLPRELTIDNGKLVERPVPELIKLRNEELKYTENALGCIKLPEAAEIELRFSSGSCDINMFTDAQGEGGIAIRYNDEDKELILDRSGMKTRFNIDNGEERIIKLFKGLSDLRIFIDKSSIEIFVNDGEAVFTSRVFPTDEENYMMIKGKNTFSKIWTLKSAVKEEFVI